MKKLMSKVFVVFFVSFVMASCTKENFNDENFNIRFKSYRISLKNGIHSDGPKPPIFLINFNIENYNKKSNFFICKAFKADDNIKSKLYLLDTLKNVIIPLYSNYSTEIKENEILEGSCTINVNDYQEYFNCSDEFLNKVDYSSDFQVLNKLFLNMINHSVIIYDQDIQDLVQVNRDSEINLEKIKENLIIKMSKPQNVTLTNYSKTIKKNIKPIF